MSFLTNSETHFSFWNTLDSSPFPSPTDGFPLPPLSYVTCGVFWTDNGRVCTVISKPIVHNIHRIIPLNWCTTMLPIIGPAGIFFFCFHFLSITPTIFTHVLYRVCDVSLRYYVAVSATSLRSPAPITLAFTTGNVFN